MQKLGPASLGVTVFCLQVNNGGVVKLSALMNLQNTNQVGRHETQMPDM
jgi:hypothetical protein